MADFKKALEVIREQEGGFSDNESDNGGATKYGISLGFLKLLKKVGDINKDGKIDIKDIHLLTHEQAEEIYYDYFWNTRDNNYGSILDQGLATMLFSLEINTNGSVVNKWLQEALLFVGYSVIADGFIGPNTITALRRCYPTQIIQIKRIIKDLYIDDRRKQCNADRAQENNLLGWLNRVYFFTD